MKLKTIILSTFFSCVTLASTAQVDGFGLRTNLLNWAFLSPGMGVDLSWNSRYMITLDGNYGDWDINYPDKRIRLSSAGVELRRYFCNGAVGCWANPNGDPYRGFYIGIDGRYTEFNRTLATNGREGKMITAGLLAGYTFRLRGNWGVDASIGAGYVHNDYNRYQWYEPAEMYRVTKEKKSDFFSLTNLNVSLFYRFKL